MLEFAELLLQEIPMGPSPIASAPPITPVEETRLKLRNDIVEYTQLILDRKHRLNSLAPTGVLPPELLAEVFMYLAHALDHNDRVDRKPSIPLIRPICELSANPYGWIKVTHVCHHWREVALSAPQLWSTIWVTNRTECITEMIARSKKVPLTIKAGRTNGPLRNDGVDLVMAHLPRIVSFDARMPPRLDQNKVYSKDAGKLKELVLQTTYEIISPGSLHLQEYFASCEIDKLERLELYAYQVQWDNKLFKSSLKHLVLHGSHAHNHNAVALEQVLRALENLPLLESLDLTSCLPLPQDAVGHSNRIVQLPKLRKLHVFSKALACHSFLRHTSFPADTSITVNCHLFRNDEVNMLLSAIRERSHYRTHDDQPLVQLPPLPSIDLRMILQEGTLELRAWTTYHTVSDLIDKPNFKTPSSSSEPLISIILRHNTNISLFTLLRAVPIDDVESLVMVGDYGTGRSEKAEWTRTFEKMPKLRELGLGEFAKDHVHQVLDHRVPCEQDGPTSTTTTGKKSRRKKQFCMPNLTLLRLQDFRENVSDAFMKRMTRSLETRKKAKVGLGTLVIKDCMNWDEESAGALKKFVGSLEYSRRFREYWESTDEYEEDHFDDYEFGGPQPHGFFGDAFMPFFGGLFADDFDDSEEEEDEEAMFGW